MKKKILFLRTNENKNGEGYFQIEPGLVLSNSEILDQDCITCQSVLSKSLGPIEEWLSRLEVSYHPGYSLF